MNWRFLVVAFLCIALSSLERTQAQSMNDSFSTNGFLDPRLWATLSPPPTSTVTVSVSNQQLQVAMGPGVGGGGVVSNCRLSGDFDVQVDYILISWPSNNNHSLRLGAFDLGGVGMNRFSSTSELNELGPGSTAKAPASGTSGQFRLVRTGSTISGFFRSGNSWILVGSETVSTSPTRINLDLGTNGPVAPGGIVVAFDNFQVNLGLPSCSQPPGLGSPGPSNPVGTVSEPITTSNGNYFYQHTDFVIPGRGLPLVFQRSYNTLDNYSGPLGANWTHGYNILLTADSASAIVKWDDGHNEAFVFNGSAYVPQPGVFSTLAKNGDGTFLLTRKDQAKFVFSTAGRLNTIQDKNGNTISLVYDGSGNLKQITNAVGRSLTLTYDSNNRIVQVTDPISRTASFGYDDNNNLIKAIDPGGNITTCVYDSNHRVTTVSLPNAQTLLANTYDASGRTVSQTNGRGFTTTLAYGTPNPMDTTVTDARGSKTIHTYDSSLRIVKVTDAIGGMTSFTYDANNDRTSVTNKNGKTTNFFYDSTGNTTGITDPLSNTIAFTYDAKNDLLTATNAKGKTTTFTYDVTGNLTAIKDALTNTTAFGYDGFGELISKTDARGDETSFIYDSLGNLTRIADALSHSTAVNYDGIGRLTSITDPNGHVASATYDPLSRLVKITDPLSNQTQFAYDSVGNLLKITDAKGNATSYAYDATNDLVSVTDALGHITRYTYDGNNNRITFTNAKGNGTAYAYDELNRLSRITDPLSFVSSYSYDPVGNVLAVTDAKGQTNQFTYEALNRLLGISYADGKAVTYSYDANGNRTNMADSHGTTAYSYDDLDRLVSVTQPGGKVVAYAHDPVGNRNSLTYPDGKVVNYSYDGANRLSGVADWLGRKTTYSYDAASNLTGTTYPNQAALAFAYDPANRLTQVRNSYRGSADTPPNPITSFTYVLDAVGNRLSVTDGSGKTTSYAYDRLNELTAVTSGTKVTSFAYDAVGNRAKLMAPGTSVNYAYDADDRLLFAGTTNLTYDANGNQISKTTTATGLPIIYRYDAANRLVTASGGAVTSTFAYDGDGNRISQSVGTGTYNYLNDVATALPVVLQESGPDGFLSYAYGLGLVSESSSTFDAFYQYDGLGSVVGLTVPAGKLLGRYAYDAWGQTDLSAPGPQLDTKNKFRFTGEALDPGTQLYYLRARYYDPSVGRFISRDKFGGFTLAPKTVNRFSYGLNNPALFTDASGQFFGWDDVGAIVGGAIVGAASQYVGDVATNLAQGKTGLGAFTLRSSLQDYATSAIKGAAAGELTLLTGGVAAPLLYTALANGIGTGVVDVATDLVSGSKIDWTGAVVDTSISAALPFFPGLGKGVVRTLVEDITGIITTYDVAAVKNAAGPLFQSGSPVTMVPQSTLGSVTVASTLK